MDSMFYRHDNIENGYLFVNPHMGHYMASVLKSKEFKIAFNKPSYVNIVTPIKTVMINNIRLQITRRYDQLSTMDISQFHKFVETMVIIIEFLASKNIYHPELWNYKSVWVHNNNYYIPLFEPSTVEKSPNRSLKDMLILVFKVIFNKNLSFTKIGELLSTDPVFSQLEPLYNAINYFTGDFSILYKVLEIYRKKLQFNIDDNVVDLACDDAERLVQQIVLNSLKLI